MRFLKFPIWLSLDFYELATTTGGEEEEEEEDEEPLLSGSGQVAHTTCTDEELQSWKDVLQEWKDGDEHRPEKVLQLVRKVNL